MVHLLFWFFLTGILAFQGLEVPPRLIFKISTFCSQRVFRILYILEHKNWLFPYTFRPHWFLGPFAKLRNSTTASSVCSSVHMGQLDSNCTDIHEIWYFNILRKSVDNVQVSLNSGQNNSTLHQDLRTFMVMSRWILLRMRTVFRRNLHRKSKHTFYVQ